LRLAIVRNDWMISFLFLIGAAAAIHILWMAKARKKSGAE